MKRTGKSNQSEMLSSKGGWIEQEKLYVDRFPLNDVYPQYKLEYLKGFFVKKGTQTFVDLEDDLTIPILVEYNSISGKSIDCIVAFDEFGKGVVFHEQGGICHTEKDLPSLTFDQLKSNRFVHNKMIYNSGIDLEKAYSFKNKVIKVKGDGEWEIKGKTVKAVASMRCGGSCEGILAFVSNGEGLWFV